MSRSLLRQLEQIKQSSTYDDQVANIHDAAVAEPLATGSGSLQHDLNNLRTLYRLAKGTTYWYDELGQYFYPYATNSGSDELRDFNMYNIKGKTLDAQSIIVPIVSDNSGAGYSAASGTQGFLMENTTAYATWANRHGLPIFASVSGAGGGDNDYFDIGGAYAVCAIDILSVANNASIVNSNGDVVYALFHDGVDNGGSGDGTGLSRAGPDRAAVGTPASGSWSAAGAACARGSQRVKRIPPTDAAGPRGPRDMRAVPHRCSCATAPGVGCCRAGRSGCRRCSARR